MLKNILIFSHRELVVVAQNFPGDLRCNMQGSIQAPRPIRESLRPTSRVQMESLQVIFLNFKQKMAGKFRKCIEILYRQYNPWTASTMIRFKGRNISTTKNQDLAIHRAVMVSNYFFRKISFHYFST